MHACRSTLEDPTVDTALGDTIFLGGSFVVVDAPLSRINATLLSVDATTGEPDGLKFVAPAVPFSGNQLIDVQVDDNGHGFLPPQSSNLAITLFVNRWELGDVGSDYLTRFDGAGAGDMTGFRFVGGGGGDFNGDGKKDFVIGAPQDNESAPPATIVGAGKAYVLFGGDASNNFKTLGGDGPLDPFALGTDVAGSNGFVVAGATFGDRTGIATTLAGDLDRDGFDDLVVGVDLADVGAGVLSGRVYVIFGGQAIPNPLNLASPGGVRMLVLNGPSHFARFARVDYLGDVNADGFVDLGVGAPSADPGGRNNAGAMYVVFGGAGICPAGQCVLNVTALNGNNGFAVHGAATSDNLGFVVNALGDFNGDGVDDFATVAANASPDAGRTGAGQAYAIYGHAAAWPPALELASLGAAGVVFNGVAAGDGTGTIAGIGDFDADGFRDLAIGAQAADAPGRTDAGKVFVLYGAPSYPSVFELGALPTADGFVMVGGAAGTFMGGRLRTAGDVNGDGLGDLLTANGDVAGRLDAGRKLIFFGQADRINSVIDVGLIDGRDGFHLNGATAGDGLDGQGPAGDVNADGYADFAIGATQRGAGPGYAYLAFGADFRRFPDADGDGLSDAYEFARGSDPNVTDSDGDGIDDGVEVRKLHSDPTATDSDGDGIGDFAEVNVDGEPGDYSPGQGDTNPNDPLSPLILDADGDGVGDSVETFVGSDPSTPNFVVYVRGATGNDANGGTGWGDAVQTNTRALQLLDAAAPYPASALQTYYVLYDQTFSTSPLAPGPLALTGPARQHVAFVGGLGPGLFDPDENRTPFTTSGPGSSVVEVTNATNVTLGALELKFGNAASGGGLRVHDGGGAVDVRLVGSDIHNNSAADGGGIHVSGNSVLTVFDSDIFDNAATSASTNGRGGGIYVAGGTVALDKTIVRGNVASNTIPAATHGGGGLYAEGLANVSVTDSVFANNKAAGGPGGGLNLIGAGSLALEHSQLLSNESTRPGAGLHVHVDAPALSGFVVFNNLFVGNAATDADADGAGIEIEYNTAAAQLAVNHNTVAYNQIRNNTATGIGGGVNIAQTTATQYDYFNNIVWFNDNGTVTNPLSPQAGDNQVLGGPLQAGGNNANESGFAGNATQSNPQFAQGFFLVQAANASVNGGANTALFWNLDTYMTDPNGAFDTGNADIGFHHFEGSDLPFNGVTAQTVGPICTGGDVVLFTPQFQQGQDKVGHLMVVELGGVTGVTLGSLTTLDPRGSGSRIARDMGNNTYAITVTGASADGVGTFTVYADDQATPRTFTIPFSTGC